MTCKIESLQICGRVLVVLASLPGRVLYKESSSTLWTRRSSRMGKASKLEMIEETHELRQIKIRDSLVAPDHQHVFVILTCRCIAEICRTSDQHGVLSERINDHVYCMNIFDVGVQSAEVFRHPSFELVLRQDIGDCHLVEERCNFFICAFQQNISKIWFRMLEHFFKEIVDTKRCGEKDRSVGLIH